MTRVVSGLLTSTRPNLIALSGIALLVAFVFQIFLFDGWTLIGDSDRLNAFLNVRKFEVDSIKQYGHVPSWNERMFMGVSMMGLHYMLPGAGLFAYLEALFPEPYLFRVMTMVSMLLVVCAGWAAYAFIKDVCGETLPAFVGAVLYCLSVYAVHRTAQLDSSFAVLIHIPIAMLVIRRASASNSAITFVALTLLVSSLIVFTFLQEAAYAVLLFGAYACYQALRRRDPLPVIMLALAVGVATVIALPRVYTVFQDFLQLDRTKHFQQTSWVEVYRFFAEGFLGRFQGEGQSIRNGTNLHEGLQLLGSSFAAFLIVAGAAASPVKVERWAGTLLALILSLALGAILYRLYGRFKLPGPFPSIEATIIFCNAVVVGVWWLVRRKRPVAAAPASLFRVEAAHGGEVLFHLLFVCFVLSVVLVTEARYLFYLAFMKVDFTHARLSIAALLPLCVLTAVFLGRLTHADVRAGSRLKPGPRHLVLAAAAGVTGVWLIEGPPLAAALEFIGFTRPIKIAWNYALPLEFARTLIALVVFLALLSAARRYSSSPLLRHGIAAALGFLIVFEGVAYAQFKLAGPHTRTHKIPFEKNNYMNVPPGMLTAPTPAQVEQLHRRLEPERFRSVLVTPPQNFPAFVAPHLANFWRLRLVDGYSAGVPWRLASFTWPADVRTLRALAFGSEAHLPWALLASLNVKYAVFVDQSLYYNADMEHPDTPGRYEPDRVQIVSNPYAVLPRHFFAERVTPRPIRKAGADANVPLEPPRGVNATAQDSGAVLMSWKAPSLQGINFRVEARAEELTMTSTSKAAQNEGGVRGSKDPTYNLVGVVGPSGRTHLSPKLDIDKVWFFRVQMCRDAGACSAYTGPVTIVPSVAGAQSPADIALQSTGKNEIELRWKAASPSAEYRIETAAIDGTFSEIARTQPGSTATVLKLSDKDIAGSIRMRACEPRGCSAHSPAFAVASAFRISNGAAKTAPPPLALAEDFRRESFAEGFPHEQRFLTAGKIDANYNGGVIAIKVDRAGQPRFLVVNELYHEGWQASADGGRAQIFPTNTVMRGIVVPAGVTNIELRFVPSLFRWQSIAVSALGVLLLLSGWILLRRRERSGAK